MKFSSIGSSSNFAQAGKATADDFVRIHKAARDNAPRMGELAMNAATRRSKERIAATEAQTKVAEAGIRVKGKVKSHEIRNQAEMKRDGAKRKAGALAVAGKMFGTAGTFMGEKRTKREVGSMDSYYDKMMADQTKNTEQLTDLLRSFRTDDTDTPGGGSGSVPTPAGNDGGSTSGSTTSTTQNTSASGLTATQTTGLKAIRDVESGSYGYDAYNLGGRTEFEPVGSGSATDGRFGKPLTQMTIGEIKQLGASGKIHATGAYQFTHNTGSFGEAANFAGLSDNDLFTPTNQDAMALAFGQKYGWQRWSGLKKDSERARLAQLAFQ